MTDRTPMTDAEVRPWLSPDEASAWDAALVGGALIDAWDLVDKRASNSDECSAMERAINETDVAILALCRSLAETRRALAAWRHHDDCGEADEALAAFVDATMPRPKP